MQKYISCDGQQFRGERLPNDYTMSEGTPQWVLLGELMSVNKYRNLQPWHVAAGKEQYDTAIAIGAGARGTFDGRNDGIADQTAGRLGDLGFGQRRGACHSMPIQEGQVDRFTFSSLCARG